MARRVRRAHSSGFKAKVALAAIKGEKTLSELTQQFDLHASQITAWKEKLTEAPTDALGAETARRDAAAPVDVKALHAKIGEQMLECDFLSGALSKAGLPCQLGPRPPGRRRPDGGNTSARFAPDNPAWTDSFVELQARGRVVFSAAIDGAVYARHGTTIDTRLTVFDRRPADDPTKFPASPGMAPDVATLLGWVTRNVPARLPVTASAAASSASRPATAPSIRGVLRASPVPAGTLAPDARELA